MCFDNEMLFIKMLYNLHSIQLMNQNIIKAFIVSYYTQTQNSFFGDRNQGVIGFASLLTSVYQ